MNKKNYYIHCLGLFISSMLVVWVVDVLLNLALVEKLIHGEQFSATIHDFLGLFLAEAPTAFIVALASSIGGPFIASVAVIKYRGNASVALLCAALSAVTVVSWLSWPLTQHAIIKAVVVSTLVGLLVLFVLRVHFRPRMEDKWSFSEIVFYALFCSLISGFSVAAIAGLFGGQTGQAIFGASIVLVLTGLVIVTLRARTTLFAQLTTWIPLAVAVSVSGYFCIASSLYGGNPQATAAADVPEKSNIVLIVLDTVRADHLKRYGYDRTTMPALERWAENAVTVMRAISAAGWTAPAHASIFSGRTVSQHGVHYTPKTGSASSPLHTMAYEDVSWLPDRLSGYGYQTIAVTANQLAIPADVKGFDHVYAPERTSWNGRSIGALTDRIFPISGRNSERFRWRQSYVDAEGIADIVSRLDGEADKPLFLFLNLVDAHSPYNPPAHALDLLGLKPGHSFSRYLGHHDLTRLWAGLPRSGAQDLTDLYDGELRYLDIHLERILQWIDSHLGKDTVVIVTSDHGEELGEHGRVGHEYGLSQALIHVPLFLRSSQLQAETLNDTVNTRYLYNFIDRIGAENKADINTLLQGDRNRLISERYPSGHSASALGPEYHRFWISLIDGATKAVGPPDVGWELFDISVSGFSGEKAISSADNEEMLRERINDYWRAFQDKRSPIQDIENMSPREIETLRALGYIE